MQRLNHENKIVGFFVILCILISLLSMDVLFINLYHSNRKSKPILDTANEYRLVDLEKSTSSFIRDYNKVTSLKKFYGELSSSDQYTYYESIIQPASVCDFKGSDVFLYDYEEGLTDTSPVDNFKTVKQVLINSNYADKIDLKNLIETGHGFAQDDYYSEDYHAIPIILGYDYNGIYEIGDVIDVMLQNNICATFKVIGFLKKDSSAVVNQELIFLDRYILSPSLNIGHEPNNLEDLMYQGFLYLQKSNGVVKLSSGYELQDFLQYLETLRIKYHMFDFGIINFSLLETNALKMLVYENMEVLWILFGLIFIFNAISIASYMIIIINNSLYRYKVYLLSGYSMRQIRKSIYIKLFYYILLPLIIATILCSIFLYDYISILFPFHAAFIAIFYTFAFAVVKFYFKSITVQRLLQGDQYD